SAQVTGSSIAGAQEPAVSTTVPSIHAPGAPVVTDPLSSSAFQRPANARPAPARGTAPIMTDPATAPSTTSYRNDTAGSQASTTAAAPTTTATSGPYSYYYPMRPRFGLFRWFTPTIAYSTVNAGPTYGTVTYSTAGQSYDTRGQTYYYY